jgi:hypothetical protein
MYQQLQIVDLKLGTGQEVCYAKFDVDEGSAGH